MNYYQYPKVIIRFPFLIQLVYGFNWINQQRKWVVYKSIFEQLKKLPDGSVVADIGCGEGQYLIPFAKYFPQLKFIAIDNHQPNTHFIDTYVHYLKLNNVSTYYTDIENIQWTIKPELAWCIGVLQYIPNDDTAIRKMADCKQLLIYQPIHNKIETTFYKWILNNFSNYDTEQKRQHIYTANQLKEKLMLSFNVNSASQHYGKIGRITHEWRSGCQNIIFHGTWPLKFVATIILIMTYPFVLLGMFLDTRLETKYGNGILIHALSKKEFNN